MNLREKWDRKAENPYSLTLLLTVLWIAVTIVAGVVMLHFYRSGLIDETQKETYDRYYVMITEDRKSAIWASIYEGARTRALEDNVYVDWLGDNLFEEYSREELMDIAIASGVDGIIVTADESEEMTKLIDEAAERDIPVVTLYGDDTQSERCSFVGIGSYNLGREYGRQAMEIIADKQKEQKRWSKENPVRIAVLVNAYAQDLDQNILCSGIQEMIEQAADKEVGVELTLMPIDDTNAFSVEESIRDIFMEQEIPDIIVCLNELNTTCVYQAVVDYNKVGQVSILGYYDSETIINAIDRNVIYSTISIDAQQMGQFCIDALQEYHELGYTSQYFTTDVTIINRQNVEQYLRKEDEADEQK